MIVRFDNRYKLLVSNVVVNSEHDISIKVRADLTLKGLSLKEADQVMHITDHRSEGNEETRAVQRQKASRKVE